MGFTVGAKIVHANYFNELFTDKFYARGFKVYFHSIAIF